MKQKSIGVTGAALWLSPTFVPQPRRSVTFLENYQGYLQADAYGGYDGIYSNNSKSDNQGIIEVACWAHARRYWHKAKEQDAARAHHVLAFISRLYEVCLLYTSPSPRDLSTSRMPSSA